MLNAQTPASPNQSPQPKKGHSVTLRKLVKNRVTAELTDKQNRDNFIHGVQLVYCGTEISFDELVNLIEADIRKIILDSNSVLVEPIDKGNVEDLRIINEWLNDVCKNIHDTPKQHEKQKNLDEQQRAVERKAKLAWEAKNSRDIDLIADKVYQEFTKRYAVDEQVQQFVDHQSIPVKEFIEGGIRIFVKRSLENSSLDDIKSSDAKLLLEKYFKQVLERMEEKKTVRFTTTYDQVKSMLPSAEVKKVVPVSLENEDSSVNKSDSSVDNKKVPSNTPEIKLVRSKKSFADLNLIGEPPEATKSADYDLSDPEVAASCPEARDFSA